jgi:hypothetical protein
VVEVVNAHFTLVAVLRCRRAHHLSRASRSKRKKLVYLGRKRASTRFTHVALPAFFPFDSFQASLEGIYAT